MTDNNRHIISWSDHRTHMIDLQGKSRTPLPEVKSAFENAGLEHVLGSDQVIETGRRAMTIEGLTKPDIEALIEQGLQVDPYECLK